MNDLIIKNELVDDCTRIEKMIYEIRGVQVILDRDLAFLYNCANGTKDINKAVKRNIEKFPSDFYFQLNKDEYYSILRFQNGTLELEQGKYSKYLPYAFTELGVSMLSSIIHTDIATEISIKIMRTFVAMRHFLVNNKDIYISLNNINNKLNYYDSKMLEYDKNFNAIFSRFDKKEQLLISGQTYDAYSSFLTIFKCAKNELMIIDAYADNTMLDIIRKLDCKIILITKNSDRLNETDITKYNSQYNNLKVIRNNDFHDRYFIIDRKNIYHSGASINSAGNKTFSINKLEDKIIIETLLKNVGDIIKK